MKRLRISFVSLVVVAEFAVIFALVTYGLTPHAYGTHGPAANETPRSASAALFQPCAFSPGIGSMSGPLKALAMSQNYSYTEYTNTTGTRPAGTLPATLDAFAGLNGVGILEIETHGARRHPTTIGGGLAIECYDNASTTQKMEMKKRYNALCSGSSTVAGMKLTCHKDPGRADIYIETSGSGRDALIILTTRGIKKLYRPQPHTIVFAGACHSRTLQGSSPAFSAFPDSIEYLGYLKTCVSSQNLDNTQKFFGRLAGIDLHSPGSGLAGHVRSVGGHDLMNKPDKKCSAFGFGGFKEDDLHHFGPGTTTVAPAVLYKYANPSKISGCTNGTWQFMPENQQNITAGINIRRSFEATIVFDTVMDTTQDATSAITADGGCGSEIRVSDNTPQWDGDHTLRASGTLQSSAPANFELQLHNDFAKSQWNDARLDGNQNPMLKPGVGPNQDDYIAKNRCVPMAPIQAPKDPPVQLKQANQTTLKFDPTLFEDSSTANFTLNVIETPVGGPGETVTGLADLSFTSSTENVRRMVVEISDLTSGGNVIPRTVISILPNNVDLDTDAVMTISVEVAIPLGTPVGTYTGTLTASELIDAVLIPRATSSFSAIVNNPPVLTLPATSTALASSTLIVPFSAIDPDGDPIAFFATILPYEAVLHDNGNGTGFLEFTLDIDIPGGGTATIIAYDPSFPTDASPSDVETMVITGILPKETPNGGGPSQPCCGRIKYRTVDWLLAPVSRFPVESP